MTRNRYALLFLFAAGAVAALLFFVGRGAGPESVPQRPVIATLSVPAIREEFGIGGEEAEQDDGATSVTTQLFRGLPIDSCEPPARTGPYSNEQLEALLEESGVALSRSSEPDFLVAAALLTWDADERQILLERALDERPGHPVAVWHRLLNCQTRDCDREAVESAALAGDPANGMVWFLIASDRIKNGQWDAAERAMRQVAAAPHYSFHFMEYTMLLERGLAATTDLGYSERVVGGIGIAAAIAIPALGEVSRACQSGDNDALVWIELCDEAGQRMTANGDGLLTVSFGYGLRSSAAKRAGDETRATMIKREGNDRVNGLLREQAQSGAQALMMNDPQVLQSYVDNFLAHGELEAMARLVEDARRLRADPTYDQCNFVGDADFAP